MNQNIEELENELKKMIKNAKISIISDTEDAIDNIEKMAILTSTEDTVMRTINSYMEIINFIKDIKNGLIKNDPQIEKLSFIEGLIKKGLLVKVDKEGKLSADPDSPCFDKELWNPLQLPIAKKMANDLIEKISSNFDKNKTEVEIKDTENIDWSDF